MKYYLILFAFLILLSLQISVTYFLWDLDKNVPLKGLLIFGLLLFLYIFYKHLTNYSKIERIKNELTIQTLFSKRKYNLTNLTSWNEIKINYRVSFRQLDLEFGGNRIRLIDHADQEGIDQLYHFLRTHYPELKIED